MDEKENVPQTPEGAAPESAAPAPAPEAAPAVQPTEVAAAAPEPVGEPTAQPAQAAQPIQPVQPVQPTAVYPDASAPQGAPVAYAQPMPSPTPALICGILAIVFSWIPIVGIVLGIVAIVMAGKYFKAGGTEGTAKGGRICGIIGIIFSGLMIVVTLIMMVVGLVALDNYSNSNLNLSSNYSSSISSSYDDVDADEQEIFDIVDPYMEKLKNQDPEMVAMVAGIMEDSFNDVMESQDLDATLQMCGVDPTELAKAMLDGFEYSYDYVYTSGLSPEANYEVMIRSGMSVGSEFYDQIRTALADVEDGSLTEADAYKLIGETLMSSVKAVDPEESWFDVEVMKDGDSWKLDEESWMDELEYFFALD